MADLYSNMQPGLTAPFFHSAAVSPSDSTDLTNTARTLYITGAGDVKFNTVGGETDTITVPANFVLPGLITRVFSTGTTATGIHAWW